DAARQPADHLVVVLGDPAHAAAAAVTIDAAAVLHDPGGFQTTLSRALEPANLARGNEILNQADQRLMMKRCAALVVGFDGSAHAEPAISSRCARSRCANTIASLQRAVITAQRDVLVRRVGIACKGSSGHG